MMTKLIFVCERAERGRAALGIKTINHLLLKARGQGLQRTSEDNLVFVQTGTKPRWEGEDGGDKDTWKGLYQTWSRFKMKCLTFYTFLINAGEYFFPSVPRHVIGEFCNAAAVAAFIHRTVMCSRRLQATKSKK